MRIVVQRDAGMSTVRVEGQVIGPWVQELRRSCDQVLSGGSELVVDLGAVSFVDRDGVEVLRRLGTGGVALVNCPRFVAEQLKR